MAILVVQQQTVAPVRTVNSVSISVASFDTQTPVITAYYVVLDTEGQTINNGYFPIVVALSLLTFSSAITAIEDAVLAHLGLARL